MTSGWIRGKRVLERPGKTPAITLVKTTPSFSATKPSQRGQYPLHTLPH